MNDRYLFRAKRIDNGEWVEGYYACYRDGYGPYAEEDHIIRDEVNFMHYIDPSTICQCTGLKGKNGKLIWENDIVSFQRDNDDCPFPDKDTKKRLGKVFYHDFRITFAIGMGRNGRESLNDDLWKYVQHGNRVEVIGNIFDNKELLEVE